MKVNINDSIHNYIHTNIGSVNQELFQGVNYFGNIDDLRTRGIFLVPATAEGTFPFVNKGCLIHVYSRGSYYYQDIRPTSGDYSICSRRGTETSWEDWKEVMFR